MIKTKRNPQIDFKRNLQIAVVRQFFLESLWRKDLLFCLHLYTELS